MDWEMVFNWAPVVAAVIAAIAAGATAVYSNRLTKNAEETKKLNDNLIARDRVSELVALKVILLKVLAKVAVLDRGNDSTYTNRLREAIALINQLSTKNIKAAPDLVSITNMWDHGLLKINSQETIEIFFLYSDKLLKIRLNTCDINKSEIDEILATDDRTLKVEQKIALFKEDIEVITSILHEALDKVNSQLKP